MIHVLRKRRELPSQEKGEEPPSRATGKEGTIQEIKQIPEHGVGEDRGRDCNEEQ